MSPDSHVGGAVENSDIRSTMVAVNQGGQQKAFEAVLEAARESAKHFEGLGGLRPRVSDAITRRS